MADVHNIETRRYNMSRVKNKNTKPEILVRKLLHSRGFRFRLHGKDLPGKPDVILPKYKLVVFVQGCFWHQHEGCKKATLPVTNRDFWREKLSANLKRDQKTHSILQEAGWRVAEVWECELKADPKAAIDKIVADLINNPKD